MSSGVALAVAGLIALVAMNVLFVVCYLAFARWSRVKIDETKLGFGPALFKVTIAGVKVAFSLIPLAASATVRGMNPYAEAEPPEPPLLLWNDAPRLRRWLGLVLAPRLASALLALPLLGPRAFAAAYVTGLRDFFAAFYGSQPLLDAAGERYRAQGLLVLVGLTAAKLVAFNTFQLPLESLAAFTTKPDKGLAKIRAVAMIVVFATSLAWIVAFVRWCL